LYYHILVRQHRRKPNVNIRIDPESVHRAKVAAVSVKKTLGQWLEEAIAEKIERERAKNK
jgi:predicted HicB family RNase H-like nuclease